MLLSDAGPSIVYGTLVGGNKHFGRKNKGESKSILYVKLRAGSDTFLLANSRETGQCYMPTLQSFAQSLAQNTLLHATLRTRLWGAPAHWPHRIYAREWGRCSGCLGNIPEVAGCVNLWRARRFWNLKF